MVGVLKVPLTPWVSVYAIYCLADGYSMGDGVRGRSLLAAPPFPMSCPDTVFLFI